MTTSANMIGSNGDSNAKIHILIDTATNLGATQEQIQEAMENREGSNRDTRLMIGLQRLISTLLSTGGSGGEFTAEDRAKLNSIPTKVSQLTNDSAFITKAVSDLTNYYNKTQVGTQISTHNTATDTHKDIRDLITGLTTRLNTALNSDDTTLDQMAEVVAYIKANKALIDSITTSKISVTDIVNDLVTNVTNKPLSAAQGVALKALIDAIVVPTLLADLTGDATHRTVTDAEKTAWNAKSNFSGSYNDLTNKPTIPTQVVIDSTLAKSGQGADAKVVGDKFASITLGLHTDGLLYVFIDGAPVGTGITLPTGTTA